MVDDRIGLVFSWDPRTKEWVKERGPDDASPPPAAPIDNGAVQTYFLDPQNGKWNSTILGLRARQISVEMKDAYRSASVAGLALEHVAVAGKPVAPEPKPKSGMPLMAGLAAVFVLVGAGAFVAQAVLRPKDVDPTAAGQTQTTVAATVAPSVAPSGEPSTSAATTSGGGGTVRTAAPTPAPTPQTQKLSVRLANGAQVFYSGPVGVTQGSSFSAVFSVVLASGQGGNDNLTIYLGDPNSPAASTNTLAAKPDANGNYVVTIRATVPKGDQRLSVIYGQVAGIYTLGAVAVR